MTSSPWVAVARLAEVPAGASHYVVADGIGLLVHHLPVGTDADVDLDVDGRRVFVTSSQCPHEDFTMDRCVLHGASITCIEHGWQFDVRSGACVAVGDDEAVLPTYPVEIRDGLVFAKLF